MVPTKHNNSKASANLGNGTCNKYVKRLRPLENKVFLQINMICNKGMNTLIQKKRIKYRENVQCY